MRPPFLDSAYDGPATAIACTTPAEWPRRAEADANLAKLAAAHDFRGQAGRVLMTGDTLFLGLGDKPNPLLLGTVGKEAAPGAYRIANFGGLDEAQACLGFALGAYAFDVYKARRRPAPELVLPSGVDASRLRAQAEAAYLVRDLVNEPAGTLGPEELQRVAEREAARFGAKCEVVIGEALLAQNYPLIHAVGRAAAEAPRLIRLRWGDHEAPRVAIVGKGVTFDSGGLDIKPSAGMRIMKKDMGGAAHALGLARLVMGLDLPVRLDVWIPAVENAIGPGAFRPGDIIRSRKGLSVEIDNTDAEGRLILADALSRACEEKPELVLDFATLTGAARTALGPDLPPFYTDDEALAAAFTQAAAAEFDPLWRMPLWHGYEGDLDSPVADLVNSASHGFAGSVVAALFLRRFVSAPAWAHFDIYAWSPKDRPGKPQGGEAQGLRAAFAVLEARYR